jgi:hypothetical protein
MVEGDFTSIAINNLSRQDRVYPCRVPVFGQKKQNQHRTPLA